MRRYGSPNEIVTDRLRSTVQQLKSWAVQKSKLPSDGQTTEREFTLTLSATRKGHASV